MNGLVAFTALTLLWPGQPVITQVAPEPLPLGATAQIDGEGFVVDQTTVAIAGVAQDVVYTQETSLLFLVSGGTPLGIADLVLSTPDGDSSQSVEVVPAAPDIQSVTPDPLVLGGIGTVSGTDLAEVHAVSLGETDCPIITMAAAVVVFEVPLEGALMGEQSLKVSAPWGFDVQDVTVVAPTAQVDQIGPNPARQGDVLTVAGVIVPLPGTSVMVGEVSAPVIDVSPGQVRVQVPESLVPGPWDIVVVTGGQGSVPAGPLWVEEAAAQRPRISGVYPGQVASAGRFWIIGENLDQVSGATTPLNLEACEPWGCLIPALELDDGPQVIAVMGTHGADIFTVDVQEGAELVQPAITGVEPFPAFRGQALSIFGEGLFQVNEVILGGVAQTIDHVSADEVRVTVDPTTPMGSEPLIVAGNSASEVFSVTVLAPLPTDDADAHDGDAASLDVPSSASDVGPAEDGGQVAPTGDDGGCAVTAQSPAWCLALGALWLWRRRARPGCAWA